jgi:hypothetical protein
MMNKIREFFRARKENLELHLTLAAKMNEIEHLFNQCDRYKAYWLEADKKLCDLQAEKASNYNALRIQIYEKVLKINMD